MKTSKKVLAYAKNNFHEVKHTTLNPDGPGAVRIHLIPPKVENDVIGSSVAIINGMDIVPVNVSWTIVLSEFIDEVNKFSGRPVSDDELEEIMRNTVKKVRTVYPFLSRKLIRNDIYRIMTAFSQIAYGQKPDEEVEYISLGEYAPFMKAPHRMDLMVSAMTKAGLWHCNQKCVHCYAAGQSAAEECELSTEEWKAIIDRCRLYCIPQVTFTGGEPTMRDDLIELIGHAAWFVTRLNTNGIKLTKEYCKQLHDASLDSLQITFYSADREVHNKLVGAERYDDTVAGIENALAEGLNLSINTPLCTLNRNYTDTLKFLYEKGVLYVTCSGLITTGNATTEASEDLQLSKNEIKAVLKDAVDYCFANNMEISFTSPGWIENEFFEELGINTPNCGACLSNMAVTPGGNVVPCQSWLSGPVLGNMLTDTWDSIWNCEESVKRRDFSAGMCGECPLRRYRNEDK